MSHRNNVLPSSLLEPVWVCSHGYAFTEFELECGMTFATMDWLMEKDRAEHELSEDRARERELALEFIAGQHEVPWPEYADRHWEVQEPEVFDDLA